MRMRKSTSRQSVPLVSVVVCTRSRDLDVMKTIASIQAGIYKNFEIIVVDNNDTKLLRLRGACAKRNVTYTFGEKNDLSSGRNLGMQMASGEIVAFTDDDCTVDKRWLSEIVEEITLSRSAITGRVLSQSSGLSDNGLLKKRWDRVGLEGYLPWRLGHGANMAFPRRVIDTVGSFDVHLGPGSVGLNGDDGDYILRCLENGFSVVYQPKAQVTHVDKPDEQLLKDAYAYQFGYRRILKKHFGVKSLIFQFATVGYLLAAILIYVWYDTFKFKMCVNKLVGFIQG